MQNGDEFINFFVFLISAIIIPNIGHSMTIKLSIITFEN